MGKKETTYDETPRPMVMIAGQLPIEDYERLVALARVRGMVTRRTSRPNVSAALREAVALGLRVAEQDTEETAM